MLRVRKAFWLGGLVFLHVSGAAAQDTRPPTLDCTLGFEGLRAMAYALPGAQHGQEGGLEAVTLSAPDTWSVHIAFTAPGHPAHPAATLRTLRKQVTGVWTADSKGCGYGDSSAFSALMADMKAGDTQLTNASRADAERRKQEQSPLGPAP